MQSMLDQRTRAQIVDLLNATTTACQASTRALTEARAHLTISAPTVVLPPPLIDGTLATVEDATSALRNRTEALLGLRYRKPVEYPDDIEDWDAPHHDELSRNVGRLVAIGADLLTKMRQARDRAEDLGDEETATLVGGTVSRLAAKLYGLRRILSRPW